MADDPRNSGNPTDTDGSNDVSDSSGAGSSGEAGRSSDTGDSRPLSRYDAILAGIPLTSLAAYLPAAALFDGPMLAQLAALAAGGAVIADGLFVHSPTDA